MKNKTLTIRVSEQFMHTLNRLCKKYNLSQSKVLELCLYMIADAELVQVDLKNRHIIEWLTRG